MFKSLLRSALFQRPSSGLMSPLDPRRRPRRCSMEGAQKPKYRRGLPNFNSWGTCRSVVTLKKRKKEYIEWKEDLEVRCLKGNCQLSRWLLLIFNWDVDEMRNLACCAMVCNCCRSLANNDLACIDNNWVTFEMDSELGKRSPVQIMSSNSSGRGNPWSHLDTNTSTVRSSELCFRPLSGKPSFKSHSSRRV